MKKLSIIVPVYNTKPYLKRCFDSILGQTKKDEIEMIIINDGSTDQSQDIIQEYQEKYPSYIRSYEKENEGIAKTRNFGIEKAEGEYLLFVDSDDYIDLQLVQKIQKHMEQGIELIKFKLQRVNEIGETIEETQGPIFEVITGQEAFNQLYAQDVLLDSPCVYVFKKDIMIRNQFTFQKMYHEDFGLIPFLIATAKTVISIPDYLYFYVQVNNSITRNQDYQKTIQKMQDALFHYDHAIQQIKTLDFQKQTQENMEIFYTNAIILKLEGLKKEDKKKYAKQLKKRRVYKNIKPRDKKQWIKRRLIQIDSRFYLKMREKLCLK